MRYDHPIFFVKEEENRYNEETGNYEEAKAKETMRYASIMDTTKDMLTLVYGKLPEQSYTVHIQNHYSDPFNYIRIENKLYQVDYTRRLRHKQSFVLSEARQ